MSVFVLKARGAKYKRGPSRSPLPLFFTRVGSNHEIIQIIENHIYYVLLLYIQQIDM